MLLYLTAYTHPVRETPKVTLKMKRNICLLPTSRLSGYVPLSPFFLPLIALTLKQHLQQTHIAGALSWCRAHICVIQCWLPVLHSALLMCDANKPGHIRPPSPLSLMISRNIVFSAHETRTLHAGFCAKHPLRYFICLVCSHDIW